MARRTQTKKSFIEGLSNYASSVLNDAQKVRVAKQSYLLTKREEIQNAYDMGYPLVVIADFASQELLQMDVPKTFTIINKDNEEVTIETKIYPGDIKTILKDDTE